MKRYILALVVSTLCSSAAFAQEMSDAEQFTQAIENRATLVINQTMETVGERVGEFNQRMQAIYALMPLESVNLEKSTIESNITSLNSFLSYLDQYRTQAKMVSKVLTDSITALRKELPATQRKKFLLSFEKAYAKDLNAFDAYLGALSKLFRNVTNTLEYLKTAEYTIGEKSIEFSKAEEHKQYSALMEKVNAANQEASKLASLSKKATEEANTVMQDVYGKNE